jgi:ribosome-associated protein
MKQSPAAILNQIAQIIYDKKGSNILAMDVKGLSNITDYILIAEGNVDRHVIAIAQAVIDQLEELQEAPRYVEGLQAGDWIVVDCSGVVVHLFQPGLREKYALEKLWNQGTIIDLSIDVSRDRVVG